MQIALGCRQEGDGLGGVHQFGDRLGGKAGTPAGERHVAGEGDDPAGRVVDPAPHEGLVVPGVEELPHARRVVDISGQATCTCSHGMPQTSCTESQVPSSQATNPTPPLSVRVHSGSRSRAATMPAGMEPAAAGGSRPTAAVT